MSSPSPTPKQSQIIWLALTGIAIATLVLLVAGLIWGLGQALHILAPVIWPLAIAGVIAYLLDPIVDKFETRGVPRTWAIIMVFACAVILMLGLLGSVVPQIVSETSDLIKRVPTYSQRVQTRVQDWINHPPALLQKLVERNLGPATTNAPSNEKTAPALATISSTNANASASTNAVPDAAADSASSNLPIRSNAWLM